MSLLDDLLHSTLGSIPRWALPESESFRQTHLKRLKVHELTGWAAHGVPLNAKNKSSLIKSILDHFKATVPAHTTPTIYRTLCAQFHAIFGTLIYRSLIKAFPPEPPVKRDTVSYQRCFFAVY